MRSLRHLEAATVTMARRMWPTVRPGWHVSCVPSISAVIACLCIVTLVTAWASTHSQLTLLLSVWPISGLSITRNSNNATRLVTNCFNSVKSEETPIKHWFSFSSHFLRLNFTPARSFCCHHWIPIVLFYHLPTIKQEWRLNFNTDQSEYEHRTDHTGHHYCLLSLAEICVTLGSVTPDSASQPVTKHDRGR